MPIAWVLWERRAHSRMRFVRVDNDPEVAFYTRQQQGWMSDGQTAQAMFKDDWQISWEGIWKIAPKADGFPIGG
jgi:hypothetical protein